MKPESKNGIILTLFTALSCFILAASYARAADTDKTDEANEVKKAEDAEVKKPQPKATTGRHNLKLRMWDQVGN